MGSVANRDRGGLITSTSEGGRGEGGGGEGGGGEGAACVQV